VLLDGELDFVGGDREDARQVLAASLFDEQEVHVRPEAQHVPEVVVERAAEAQPIARDGEVRRKKDAPHVRPALV
jgi:hypothetical protein